MTLGIPRLLELLHAVKKIKTPCMSLRVRFPEGVAPSEGFCTSLTRQWLTFLTVGDVVVSETIRYAPEMMGVDAEGVERWSVCHGLPSDYWEMPWLIRLELAPHGSNGGHQRPPMRACFDTLQKAFPALDLLYIESGETMIVHIRDPEARETPDPLTQGRLKHTLNAVRKTGLCGTREVEGCFVRSEEDGWYIETQGSCLSKIHSMCPHLDERGHASNDPNEVLGVLGIEAARSVLLNEIRSVLSFDGSYVGLRHLQLLVDVMSMDGVIYPINSHGFRRSNHSFLAQLSFERVFQVLQHAATNAVVDPVAGVSENIMLGNLVDIGTGGGELFLNEHVLEHAIGCVKPDTDAIECGGQAAEFTPTSYYGCSPGFSPGLGVFSPDQSSKTHIRSMPYTHCNGGTTQTQTPCTEGRVYSHTSPMYTPGPQRAYSPSSPAYSPSPPPYSPATTTEGVPSSPAYSPSSHSSPAVSHPSSAASPSTTDQKHACTTTVTGRLSEGDANQTVHPRSSTREPVRAVASRVPVFAYEGSFQRHRNPIDLICGSGTPLSSNATGQNRPEDVVFSLETDFPRSVGVSGCPLLFSGRSQAFAPQNGGVNRVTM